MYLNECRIKSKEFSFLFLENSNFHLYSSLALNPGTVFYLCFSSAQTKHFRLLFYRLLVDPHSFTASWCRWRAMVVRSFWCCILALLLVMPENAHLIFLIQTYNLILKMNLKRIFLCFSFFFVFTYAVLNSELSFQWKDIQI